MTPALLLILAAAPCVVTGSDVTTRTPVELRPGVKASLHGVAGRAVLDGRSARLRVEQPLAFDATTARLRVSVHREVSLFDGGVVLGEGAQVQWQHTRGDTLGGEVLLVPDDDELEHEDKRPILSFALSGIPCAALTLDPPHGEDLKHTDGDGPLFHTRAPVTLHVGQNPSSPSVKISAGGREDVTLFFERLATRGPMALVQYVGLGDRVALRGWVPVRSLQRVPEGEGTGRGTMCTGDHDAPMAFGRVASSGVPRHDGPLTLQRGTVLSVDCPTKREPERRCPVATVTAPLEATVRWYGGPTADATLREVLLDEGVFSVDATAVAWPDAGVQGAR